MDKYCGVCHQMAVLINSCLHCSLFVRRQKTAKQKGCKYPLIHFIFPFTYRRLARYKCRRWTSQLQSTYYTTQTCPMNLFNTYHFQITQSLRPSALFCVPCVSQASSISSLYFLVWVPGQRSWSAKASSRR